MADSSPTLYPTPPGLHWVVLAIMLLGLALADGLIRSLNPPPWLTSVSLVSLGFFAWEMHQAVFVRALDPKSRGVWMTAVGVVFGLAGNLTSRLWLPYSPSWILTLLGFAFVLGAQFDMRRSLEDHYNANEGIRLRINSVLLLILGMFYLQYHFHRIAILNREA